MIDVGQEMRHAMVSFEQLSEVVGGLKGAPTSVVLALMMAGRPLSQGELLLLTGYSVKPVRKAVRALLAQGILYRDGPRVLGLAPNWFRKAAQNAAGLAESAAPDEAHNQRPDKTANQQGVVTAGSTAESPVAATQEKVESARWDFIDRGSGRIGRHDAHFGPPDQQIVVVADPDQEKLADQQQHIPEEAAHLAQLMRQMGISGRAFWRLVARHDLIERPELALAWWWYYRCQEGVRNPAGAAISRLDAHDRPPDGYLALAGLWPAMPADIREELASMVRYNWPAEQIAGRLQPDCPGLTAGAVRAYMALYLEELEG